ncbi:hypothetical protein GCM10020331_036820 [Ectobacillus funiculus]
MNYILKPIDREKFREQIEEVKERIIKQRSEQKEVQEKKELQLTYTKQVQLLSEVTWNHDTDVSLLNWTREFPKGTYRLIYVSTDQKLSKKTKSEEWEAWRAAIEKLITELFGREWQDDHRRYWWWRGTKLSFLVIAA